MLSLHFSKGIENQHSTLFKLIDENMKITTFNEH